ncbi:MAG: ABC transporter ATP-binding protein [Spirochaetaceae bacterium]|jgi:oligopeptide/dipeptide ABC transporter ATP-binding protein|nr:ABC transporter ATP-binding protein [Spirochaetaceae bacterium]
MKLLEVQELVTTFKTGRGMIKAINGVDFEVDEGERVALVGESGCGKSVTMQSVLRLYDERKLVRYSGKINYKNRDLLGLPQKEMRNIRGREIAMVFQDALSALDPIFTVEDQISESLKLHQGLSGRAAREAAAEMLQLVGISEPYRRLGQYPFELSGGMRQRVMIAVALSCKPALLIADEPTSALDVTIQAQIMELIMELNRKLGMAVILITHDLAIVAETCTRALVMYLGQIVEEAPVEDLFVSPRHPYTLALLKSIPKISGERPERLYAIDGMVPQLDNIPAGCRFSPRCPLAEERCRRENPPLVSLRAASQPAAQATSQAAAQKTLHRSRCWRTKDIGGTS